MMMHQGFPCRVWLSLAVLLLTATGVFTTSPVLAEGSRSLYPASYPGSARCGTGVNQGCRANLDVQPGSTYLGKITRRTFLYVYAQQGEYLLLGSRNRTNGGDIRVYNPQDFGNPGQETIPSNFDFACSVNASGPNYGGGSRGQISTRRNELAGPNSADNSQTVTNGYVPCAYRAPATGLYGVIFTPARTGGGANGVIDPPALANDSVSAWDVTVRDNATSTTDINGRLFTYAWAAYTGGNSRPVYSSHYYVTSDGYRYSQALHGFDPNGYVLFANAQGFFDNGQPLYKDLRGTDQNISGLPPGVTTQTPQFPLFFSDVSPTAPTNSEIDRVLAALNIPATPLPPAINNVSFAGHLPTGHTTTGVGGAFRFTTTNTTSYKIVVSRDGVDFSPDNLNNAVLTGFVGTGTYIVQWDGKDQNRLNFPPSPTPYAFRVFGNAGEVHFPIVDDENNGNGSSKATATFGGGPEITALNGIGAGSTTVFFDDRGYLTASGTLVGNLNGTLCPGPNPPGPAPDFNLSGVDSTPDYINHQLYRWWLPGGNANADCRSGAGWGDAKALNLWTYLATPPQANALYIDPIIYDGATTVGAPATATPGSIVQGGFTFANNGNTPVTGLVYTLTLGTACGNPAVTFGNLPAGVSYSCSGAGVYTFIGMPPSLSPGQSVLGVNPKVPMTFSYRAPNSGIIIVATHIGIGEVDDYPPNNDAVAQTGVGPVDVFTQVSVPATALVGESVQGTLVYGNLGGNPGVNVTYEFTLDATAGTHPASVQFGGLPAGVTYSYNPATGSISFSGLPTTLAPGQSFSFGFTYPMPITGPVTATTKINTTSADANPANNQDIGVTATSLPGLAIQKTLTSGDHYTAVGNLLTYAITVTNTGNTTLNNIGVTDPGVSLTCSPSVPAGSLAPGATIQCTGAHTVTAADLTAGEFTNTATAVSNQTPPQTASVTAHGSPLARLIIVKQTVGGDGRFTFVSPQLGGFILTTVNGAAQRSFGQLTPGAYAVSESVPAGWTLTSATCSNGDDPGSLTIDPAEEVTCTFTNTRRGSLTVVKTAQGGNGAFAFTSPELGPFTLTTLGGTTQRIFNNLEPGKFSLSETVPTGWDQSSATCTDGSSPSNISIAPGENVVCTFANIQRGSLTIVKNTLGGDGVFSFNSPQLGGFSLTTMGGAGQQVFGNLAPGTFSISENVPAGWTLGDAACSDGSHPNNVAIGPGDNVTCTFANTKLDTIIVVKRSVGGDGRFPFTSQALGDFTIQTVKGEGQKSFSNLQPGTYDLSEAVPEGWTLSSATCSDGSPLNQIDLRAGETVVCVFIDLKEDTLIIEKQTQGGDGLFSFTSPNAALGNFSLTTVNGVASKTFPGLTAGTYSLSEVVPAGWDLSSATCDNGDSPAKINFAPGQTVKCTFANTRINGFIVTAILVNGRGTVSCVPASVPSGGSSICTAVPDPGFRFQGWTGACAVFGSNPVCSLTNIQTNQTSTVSFTPIAPPPNPVPTLGGWGLLSLSSLLLVGAGWRRRRMAGF